MGLWADLNNFSDYDKRIPCLLCKRESEPTLVGGHFKCSTCSHLFNEDGSPTNIDCFCDICQPKASDLPDLPEHHEIKCSKKKVVKNKKKK